MDTVFSLTSNEAVDEADEEIEELNPQVPKGQVLPLAAELGKQIRLKWLIGESNFFSILNFLFSHSKNRDSLTFDSWS